MKKKWIAVILILALLITAVVIAVVLRSNDSEKVLEFAEFLAMSPAEQQEYMESYEDIMDFLEWYRTAEEKYKSEQSGTEIEGDGNIDIGDYID